LPATFELLDVILSSSVETGKDFKAAIGSSEERSKSGDAEVI